MYQVWSKSKKDVDSRVFTRMLCGKKFDPEFQILLRTKYVPSLVKIHWDSRFS